MRKISIKAKYRSVEEKEEKWTMIYPILVGGLYCLMIWLALNGGKLW